MWSVLKCVHSISVNIIYVIFANHSRLFFLFLCLSNSFESYSQGREIDVSTRNFQLNINKRLVRHMMNRPGQRSTQHINKVEVSQMCTGADCCNEFLISFLWHFTPHNSHHCGGAGENSQRFCRNTQPFSECSNERWSTRERNKKKEKSFPPQLIQSALNAAEVSHANESRESSSKL